MCSKNYGEIGNGLDLHSLSSRPNFIVCLKSYARRKRDNREKKVTNLALSTLCGCGNMRCYFYVI